MQQKKPYYRNRKPAKTNEAETEKDSKFDKSQKSGRKAVTDESGKSGNTIKQKKPYKPYNKNKKVQSKNLDISDISDEDGYRNIPREIPQKIPRVSLEETAVDNDIYINAPDGVETAGAEAAADPAVGGEPAADVESVEIVGVRFKQAGKVYYFAPGEFKLSIGDRAVVETSRGMEIGEVSIPNRRVPVSGIISPLRTIVRPASEADIEHCAENKRREREAAEICAAKIKEHGLKMKLVDVEYTFDNSKLLFYFTSEGRIDFRDLVKDLASVFRTRIELRQIGIRDEAKLMGGLGICGRTLCCSSFLSDFTQVSIKMAKEQNLSLNSIKISGNCGRLMCCLRYEQETYEEEIAKTPAVDSIVKTADGTGVVVETNPLAGLVRVRFTGKGDPEVKVIHRDDVTVIGRREVPADEEQNGRANWRNQE